MLGIEDELIPAVNPPMAGDDLRPATITTSSTKPFNKTVWKERRSGAGPNSRSSIARQPGRGDLGRLLLARLEQTVGYAAQHRQIA
jgi:hypothetical protein